MKTESLPLAKIRTDGGTQPRAAINPEVVADYRERMEEGDVFPAIIVFFDGTHYWLADGFHRVEAALEAEFANIEAEVHQGSLLDAQWYSYGANRTHDQNGLRRSNADKRRAVEAALRHGKSSSLSDRQVADHVGVSHTFIAKHRPQVATVATSARRLGRDGKSYPATQPERRPTPERVTESEKTIVNTETGEVIENAAVVTVKTEKMPAPAKPAAPARPLGAGIDLAYKAIAILKEIPLNDSLRGEGLETVARWIEHNK